MMKLMALILVLALIGCGHGDAPDGRALVDAAKNGDVKALSSLLDSGGSVEARNESGRTLVALAALKGNTAVVRLLLDRGADPNARDSEGMTPLMWAAFGGSSDSVKALLDKRADPAIKASDGKTARDWVRPGDDKVAGLLR